jgi:pimeloyl-ACP methyl ester carboxylesterase
MLWISTIIALATPTVGPTEQTCQVDYKGAKDAAVVLFQLQGSGLYAGIDEDLGFFASRVEQGKLAVLQMNKPGVLGPEPKKKKADLDPGKFAAYRSRDLVACGVDAVKWAEQHRGRPARWILAGHSEGALVQTWLANELLDRGTDVATVMLSGTPISEMKANLERQFETDDLEGMYAAMDEQLAKNTRKFVIEAGFAPPLLRALSDVDLTDDLNALVGRRVPMLVQHGLKDKNAPIEPLRTWEARINAPWLSVQWVQGGHRLNLSAVAAQTMWVDAILYAPVDTSFMGQFFEE